MKIRNSHLNGLIVFYIVAEEKSVARASERLQVTQPAVSIQIKRLERVVGTQLIVTRGKTVALTESGKRLLPYAAALYHSAVKAENLLKGRLIPTLRLGVCEGLMLYCAPVIEMFNDLYPTVNVTVREGHRKRLITELSDLKHDLCIVASRGGLDTSFSAVRLSHTERMVLVVSPKHPLAEKLIVRWEDIARYPLLLQHEGSIERKVLLKELMLRDISPFIAAEVGMETMKRIVSKGKGVALMFLTGVRYELDTGKLTALPFPEVKERFAIDVVCRREMRPLLPCVNFLSLAKEYFASQELTHPERHGAQSCGTGCSKGLALEHRQ
ncbi:MAG: HTH-type transcriptional regulator GltC [Syntrophorhabdus sp. PtaU1.Bin153]|nr:MAG: HTH-type transcriptional regulator GltC [Syntrophorhabdus sp. PtaU1.Bin153]